jgi:cytidyltransferase-like protein
MYKLVLATGGFDPIHSGHIEYLKAARSLGDSLWVGINSDKWLVRKKGKAFQTFSERHTIINAIRYVDCGFGFDDDDDTAKDAIFEGMRKLAYCNVPCKLIFANGGDRRLENIPEMTYDGPGSASHIEFIFGVGGKTKRNSSGKLLRKWKEN